MTFRRSVVWRAVPYFKVKDMAAFKANIKDGFYPKGVRTNSDAFKPMGALVKAVLINGAQRIVGGTNANFQGSSWPNMDQGHGVVELDATLNFNDVFKGQGLYARGDFNNMERDAEI